MSPDGETAASNNNTAYEYWLEGPSLSAAVRLQLAVMTVGTGLVRAGCARAPGGPAGHAEITRQLVGDTVELGWCFTAAQSGVLYVPYSVKCGKAFTLDFI